MVRLRSSDSDSESEPELRGPGPRRRRRRRKHRKSRNPLPVVTAQQTQKQVRGDLTLKNDRIGEQAKFCHAAVRIFTGLGRALRPRNPRQLVSARKTDASTCFRRPCPRSEAPRRRRQGGGGVPGSAASSARSSPASPTDSRAAGTGGSPASPRRGCWSGPPRCVRVCVCVWAQEGAAAWVCACVLAQERACVRVRVCVYFVCVNVRCAHVCACVCVCVCGRRSVGACSCIRALDACVRARPASRRLQR